MANLSRHQVLSRAALQNQKGKSKKKTQNVRNIDQLPTRKRKNNTNPNSFRSRAAEEPRLPDWVWWVCLGYFASVDPVVSQTVWPHPLEPTCGMNFNQNSNEACSFNKSGMIWSDMVWSTLQDHVQRLPWSRHFSVGLGGRRPALSSRARTSGPFPGPLACKHTRDTRDGATRVRHCQVLSGAPCSEQMWSVLEFWLQNIPLNLVKCKVVVTVNPS